jgi:hypothetical protein
MIRCLNSGPHSLALSVYESIFTRALFPYSILIILAILNAFALQFTSTLLLTDFGSTEVVRDFETYNIIFGLGFDRNVTNSDNSGGSTGIKPGVDTYGGLDYWKSSPLSYARFAEYKEEAKQGVNYVDTGRTLRGFPPQTAQDIDSHYDPLVLRDYTGPMMVVDARVVCVRPTVSNLSLEASSYYPTISGNFNFENTHPDLKANPALNGSGVVLNCTIPTSDIVSDRPYWQTSLCTRGVDQGRLMGGITGDDDVSDSNPMGHTSAHLLLNATGGVEDWTNAFGNGTETGQTQSSGSFWTRYSNNNVSVEFTLCFVNPLPGNYKVHVTSDVAGDDGYMFWNSTLKSYNTSYIQEQYGATGKDVDPKIRGQFTLAQTRNWTASRAEHVYGVETQDFIWDTLVRTDFAYLYAFLYNIATDDMDAVGSTTMFSEGAPPQYSVHRSHAVIFQDILKKTGNPALALQTIWTVLMQMAYYDFYYEYDATAEAVYKVSSFYVIPCRWRAFGCILGLLGLHFVLIFIAIRLFLLRTEMSLLGNAWQAISQVVSTDTANVVHHGATATDGEVKTSGMAAGRIRITKSLASGRTEAIAVRERHGATYSAPAGHI